MVTQSNFRLINELYDNIALLDQKLGLIFQGSSLQKLLLDHNCDLSLLNSSDSAKISFINNINEAVKSINISGKPVSFTFKETPFELIILPASDSNYIFGLKEKLIHFVRIERDLLERGRELDCLFNISKESESIQNLESFFEKCTGIIKAGFQFPESTDVNIIVNNKCFGKLDPAFDDLHIHISTSIYVNQKIQGEIKVFIPKQLNFLDEEIKLIEEIAKRFSKILEKVEETSVLEKQKKILTAKNKALFKMTEECHQKREQLKTFIRAIADRIIVVDRDLNILMSNKDQIGESGKCYEKLFNSDTRCVDCPTLKTFETSSDSFAEKKMNDRYFTLSAHPIYTDDSFPRRVDRVLEVCRDLTDNKRMEAQMFQTYKLASLGKLVAGVAHEINNPNTFILGNIKIVQEAFEDIFPILDEQFTNNSRLKIARLDYKVFRENINILINDMVNGANRTKKIVEDLRNFAKKEEEELNDDVDLNFIIKNQLTLTKKHIKKFAQLEIELNEKIPVFRGNINKIEQVLLNLTMNASDSIDNGNGLIKIKTDYDEESKKILLSISDNGCGIEESVLKNIFDPFFTTKRNKGGIGLGLSITYGIVKEHGGSIEVESKEGQGTTFIIRFPAKQGK